MDKAKEDQVDHFLGGLSICYEAFVIKRVATEEMTVGDEAMRSTLRARVAEESKLFATFAMLRSNALQSNKGYAPLDPICFCFANLARKYARAAPPNDERDDMIPT